MMMQDQTEDDARIAHALTAHAPPARDAMFRIGVLERREQQRFRRRSLWLLTGAFALAAIWVIGFRAGAGTLATAAMAVLVAGLVGSWVVAMPVAGQLLRRLARPAGAK